MVVMTHGRKPTDPVERFWSKVARSSPDDCWLWTGSVTRGGYGKMRVGSLADGTRSLVSAHRFAYELEVGPIPEGLVIDHLCRTRRCVNPAHLEVVTTRENLLRGDTLTARGAATTHCPRGHAYDEENTYVSPSGSRNCRSCARLQDAARRKKVAS